MELFAMNIILLKIGSQVRVPIARHLRILDYFLYILFDELGGNSPSLGLSSYDW